MEPTPEEPAYEIPIVVVEERALSHGVPSRRLLGRLPIARLIPQDVHSLLDYAGALGLAVASFLADSPRARVAGMALGAGTLGVSLTTDYRLSVAKLIPIETHEVLDYVVGAAAIAAPFLLGYRRRDPLVSAVQVASGAALLLVSMFTDYRAFSRRPIGFHS